MMADKWPPEIVLVEWVDSVGTSRWDPYESKRDSLKDEHMEHTSVGYLVKKTRKWVALTHSVGLGEGCRNCCDTIQIPMCAVKKLSYLKTNAEKP